MRKTLAAKALQLSALFTVFCVSSSMLAQSTVPSTEITALDDHAVQLPRDLSSVNVFIVGFSRVSADATTAWEIPVRTQLANNKVGFYDVAVLASIPSFFRGWINRSLRRKVPAVLQPRFLPVYTDESGWKSFCAYDDHAPDAPYVLLTDHNGKVLWATHEAYSADAFNKLKARAEM